MFRIKTGLFLTFLYGLSGVLFAQSIPYTIQNIPKQVKKGSHAVVRYSQTKVNILSVNEMTISFDKIITVLDAKGDDYAAFYQYYGKDEKILNPDIRIYDLRGHLVKKIKPSEIQDLPADDGFSLYTDSRVKYFRPVSNFYPYTLRISYTFKTNNTAIIPSFIPAHGYDLGVVKSIYTISYPTDIKLYSSLKNPGLYNLHTTKNGNTLTCTLRDAAPLHEEAFSPSFYDLVPVVKFRLDRFSLLGVKGSAGSWEELGDWIVFRLFNGINTIPSSTKNEILNLVRDIPDQKEKAKKIYEYMQRKTRYVSIQIGIGGWRPAPAYEVDQKAYGDCKALVNYTKSLMDVAGIQTYPALVYAGTKRDVDTQAVGLQGNHVILMYPGQKDTVWMECTNHKIPFGFLGSFTDDRQALVVKPYESKIVKTPAYKDDQNKITYVAQLNVDDSLALHAQTRIRHCGLAYEDVYRLEDLKKDEIKTYYKQQFHNIPGLKTSNIRLRNDKDNFCFEQHLDINTKNYFTKFVDNQYFFRLNMFPEPGTVPPGNGDRKLPVYIRNGFVHLDSIRYRLPGNYVFEYLPEDKKIKSRFGTYEIKIRKISDRQIIYERTFILHSGTYPKETYAELRNFLKQLYKFDNKKAIIKKTSK